MTKHIVGMHHSLHLVTDMYKARGTLNTDTHVKSTGEVATSTIDFVM